MTVSAATFNGLNLATLPAPPIIATLSYEAILANWITAFQGYCTTSGIDYTAILDSDPAYKVLQAGAYQELVIRQQINDAAKANMVAYAIGADLDNLGADLGVARETVTPANSATGTAAVMELDDPYRQRIALAPQGFSVAGPEGAYVYFAKSADPTVQDVSITTPAPADIVALVMATLAANGAPSGLVAAMTNALAAATFPGTVDITVLGSAATGIPTSDALANVTAELNATSIRPLTDQVIVAAATTIDYALIAALTFLPGYDQPTVTANALASVTAYQKTNFALGAAHTLAGLSAALMVPGMKNIAISNPAADVTPTLQQAAICAGITLTPAGTET